MKDLRQQLEECLKRRACLLAIGNEALGDDGFGMAFGKALLSEASQYPAIVPPVQRSPAIAIVFAGTTPENCLEELRRFAPQTVLLLDAVEIDAEPGSIVFMAASEIWSRFLQISTHKLALGTLASLIEAETGASVWLLGVKAKELAGMKLSQPVEEAMSCLKSLLLYIIRDRQICAHGDWMVEPSGRGGTSRRQRVETERKDIKARSAHTQFAEKSHPDFEPNGAAIQVGEGLA